MIMLSACQQRGAALAAVLDEDENKTIEVIELISSTYTDGHRQTIIGSAQI